MAFKKYLNSLSKFQTFQLYTILTICVLFPYFKFIDIKKDEKIYSNENFIQVNNNIKQIKEKIQLPNYIKVLKELELETKKYKSLSIQNFNINKRSININGIASKEEFLNFLIFCENYSVSARLNTLALKPITNKKNLFNFSLSIKFKKKYLPILSSDKQEDLEKKILSLGDKKVKNKIKLQAIFDSHVIINDKLLFIGDELNGFKIKKINKDHILLSNKNVDIKLYLEEKK